MNTTQIEADPLRISFVRRFSEVILILLYPAITAISAWLYGDTLILQKVLARWFMPAGILFIVITACFVLSISRRQYLLSFVSAMGLSVSLLAIEPIAAVLIRSLEDQYPDVTVNSPEPFDTIVVLGGGTGLTISGRPQLGINGERLSIAARLVNAGLANKIVLTGDALINESNPYEELYDQSIYLLKGMGISDVDTILKLDGRNTSEEIQSLKNAPELWQGKRCGLITSAFHIPRAMTLCKKFGVDVIPIPADYLQPGRSTQPLSFVPYAEWIDKCSRILYEYLGMQIGR